jgi:hypothetical protein
MSDSSAPVPDLHLEQTAGLTTAPPAPAVSPPAAAPPPAPVVAAVPHSAAVTLVGILNFVVAALGIPVGVLLLLLASALEAPVFRGSFGQVGGGGPIVTFLRIMAVFEFICDGALIFAGIGVLLRKPGARILTLVLAGLMLLSGLGYLSHPDPTTVLGALLHIAYAVFVFIVLLRPRYAAEFAQTAAPPPTAPASAARPVERLSERVAVAPGPGLSRRAFALWVVLILVLTHVACVAAGLFADAGLTALQKPAQKPQPVAAPKLETQEGKLPLVGDKEFRVYYGYPYVSPPNLTVELAAPSGPDCSFWVKEQQPDSFTVVPKTKPGTTVSIHWTAKGRYHE